jgi:glycosyltransferase involved in cell wall biosynthesis
LLSEFSKVSRVTVLSSENGDNSQENFIARRLQRYGLRADPFVRRLYHFKKEVVSLGVDLIYSNTATNGDIVSALADIGCPVITHVHELEYALGFAIPLASVIQMKESTNHYIAVSQSVKKNLIESHFIPEAKIDLAYEFIPAYVKSKNQAFVANKCAREELGVPLDDYIVGGCGTIDWRKGSDLFVQLAGLVSQRRVERPVWFIWLGGKLNGSRYFEAAYQQLCHDIKLLGLENSVKFIGSRENAIDYIAAFDVLTMTSREDPFPLVCLEAALMEVPIVCFDKAGGTIELVEDDAGFVVPYLDLPCMADKVVTLLNSRELRLRYGQRAANKVRCFYDVEVVAPKIYDVMNRFM